MLIRKPADIPSSEITSQSVYRNRRQFMRAAGSIGAGIALAGPALASAPPADEITPREIATGYNNFYEFGTDKSDPAEYAHQLTTDPWTVKVSGAANKTGKFAFEDVIKGLIPEDRIYRFRCVEAWSMVVPWQGIPLSKVLDKFEPTGDAKYVELKTLVRPSEMPGQASLFSSIDWPYVEGLRMDEAYQPLTLMVTPEQPVITDPNATVAWSGNLAPEFRTDISLKTFFGRGSGESIQMLFQGSGFVVIQPFEEVTFQGTAG